MKLRIALIIAVVGAVSSPASAQFVAGRSQWEALGARKADYIMGVVDGYGLADAAAPYGVANREGIGLCVHEMPLTNHDLVTMVDEAYARDAARWSERPRTVIYGELFKACRSYIDRSRVAAGLEPLPQP